MTKSFQSDDEIRAEWRAAGGDIHGPTVETMTMPEGQYFAFRRGLARAPIAVPSWSASDSAAATAEGWDVFDSSARGLEIERIDVPEEADAPTFASDDEAISHVYMKAQDGSALHQKALLLTLTQMQGFAWSTAVTADDARVERFCEAFWPSWKNPSLRSDHDRERVRAALAFAEAASAAQKMGEPYSGAEERAEAAYEQQLRDRADQMVPEESQTTDADMEACTATEPASVASYSREQIALELERTAMDHGYYGNALRVAKDFPQATPSDRALLDRWANGRQDGLSDRTDLCAFAQRICAAPERTDVCGDVIEEEPEGMSP